MASSETGRDVLEPTTHREAQAVINNIRADKGYISAATMREIEKMPTEAYQEVMKGNVKLKEAQADYTKR